MLIYNPNTSNDQLTERNDVAKFRLMIAAGLFCLAFFIVAIRLLELGVVGQNIESSQEINISTIARRADIVDCKGEVLATTIPTASLYANPQEIIDADESAIEISKIFPDLKVDYIKEKLKRKSNFIWIKRHLSPRQQQQVLEYGIPGVHLQNDYRRVYTQGALLSHVLGMTNIDNMGVAGIEKYFDDYLLKPSSEALKLSIDLRIQHVVVDELQKAMKHYNAIGAVGIVMDVHTGGIRAMVSLPSFDPNRPNDIEDRNVLFNKATCGLYEIGSVFKALTVSMGFKYNKITMNSKYDATKPIKIGRFTITDFKAKNSWLTVPELFVCSSNIGASKIALDVGSKLQREFLESVNFLKPITLEIPEVASPIVPSVWKEVTTITTSYGYGISVTPLHLASAYSFMTNGGNLYNPTLVYNKESENTAKEIISKEISDKMRLLLRAVVVDGANAKAINVGSLGIMGKSATAYILENGKYNHDKVRTAFGASFPAISPKYAVVVMLEEPKSAPETYGYRTGGWNAGPTAAAIIERIAYLLGIAPINEEEFDKDLPFVYFSKRNKKDSVT